MARHGRPGRGFLDFYRRYTKTWIHALATAALTALGTLTFVHRGFAVLAVAAYLLPPLVLYFGRSQSLQTLGGDHGETGDRTGEESGRAASGGTEKRTGGDTDPNADERARWRAIDVPTDATLYAAVGTDRGAYAVGADGVVLAVDGADGWRVALEDGPGAAARDLRGADATADGDAVWFCGDGGALGRLDAETGRHADYTAPSDLTDTFEDVAVGGPSGDETVLLVNGSGEALRGRYRSGDLAWGAPTKPGSGSSLIGAAFADPSVGYLCDTADGAFETDDGGATFRRIGVDGVSGTLTDVATDAPGRCAASADDGIVHGYDEGNWTPTRVNEGTIRAISRRDGETVACGDGVVFERSCAAAGWERIVPAVGGPLYGIALGADRAVAVGAGGSVVERR